MAHRLNCLAIYHWAGLVCLLATSPLLFAEPSAGGGSSVGDIDVEAAVAMALEQAPRLAVAHAEVEVARHDIPSAGRLSTSELRVSDLDAGDWSDNGGSFDVSIRLRLPEPGWARARTAQRGAASAAAQHDLEAVAWSIEVEVRTAFEHLALVNERLALEAEIADETQARAEAIAALCEAGAATTLEASLAQVDVEEARARLRRREAQRDALRVAIANLIGAEGGGDRIAAPAALVASSPPLELDALIALALEGHPARAAAKSRVEEAAVATAVERVSRLPYFSFVEVGREVFTGVVVPPEGVWNARFAIGLPPLVQANHALARARAEETLAREALNALELELEAEIRRRVAALEAAGASLASTETLMRTMDLAVSQMEELVAAGEQHRVDLAEVRIRRARLRLSRGDDLGDYVDARAALLMALGAPLP